MLTDSEILKKIDEGKIVIQPFDRKCLGSNSYDVHIGRHLAVYTDEILDMKKDNPTRSFEIPEEGFVLRPEELYLGSTVEYTETHGLIPIIDGKSSTGRVGVSIHLTAGKGDIGFKNHWTLEITCKKPVRVYPGQLIAQIFYFSAVGEVLVPYSEKHSAKYNERSENPVSSKMWKNFTDKSLEDDNDNVSDDEETALVKSNFEKIANEEACSDVNVIEKIYYAIKTADTLHYYTTSKQSVLLTTIRKYPKLTRKVLDTLKKTINDEFSDLSDYNNYSRRRTYISLIHATIHQNVLKTATETVLVSPPPPSLTFETPNPTPPILDEQEEKFISEALSLLLKSIQEIRTECSPTTTTTTTDKSSSDEESRISTYNNLGVIEYVISKITEAMNTKDKAQQKIYLAQVQSVLKYANLARDLKYKISF